MPEFGNRSNRNLEGVHPLMIAIAQMVVSIFDISITAGVRSTQEQQELYAIGRTKEKDRSPVTTLDGINKKSNHQVKDDGFGYAIDAHPYPIDFSNELYAKARYYMMAGYFFGVAFFMLKETEYKLRWGGDWDSDKNFEDQSFDDLPHFELIKN